MTKKEAIEYLHKLFMQADITDAYGDMDDTELYETAIDMATEALKEREKAGDLIRRQDAIDACLNGVCACVSDCVDEIKQLPPVQQWIPVTERLPDNAQNVLVCDNEGNDKCYDYVEVGYFEDEYWYDTLYDPIAVIAWMPLPEPYKGGMINGMDNE